MGKRAAVRKPREERWAELIEVATRVACEKGYEAASLQEIADRLGRRKGSLYFDIRFKKDLLYEVVSSVHQERLGLLRRLAEGTGEPPERLENVIRGHVEHTWSKLGAHRSLHA